MNFVISVSGASTYGGFAFARKIGSGAYTTIYESTRDSNGPYQYGHSTGGASSQAHYTQGFLIYIDQPNTISTCTYKIMSRPYASGYVLTTNLAGGQFTGSSYCILQEVQQ